MLQDIIIIKQVNYNNKQKNQKNFMRKNNKLYLTKINYSV